jgi:hypothetical protein
MATTPTHPTATVEPVNSHIRKMRDLVEQFGEELSALQKLQATLEAAISRLDRGSSLVHMEAQHVEALIKRAEKKPAALAALAAVPIPMSVSSIVDRVGSRS